MGRYFALTLNIPNQTKAKTKAAKGRNLIPALSFWIFALLLALGIAYVFLVTSLSTKSYEIKRLEQRFLEIRETNKKLEIEAASLKSIQSIENEVKTLNLVPSGAVKYLGDTDFAYR